MWRTRLEAEMGEVVANMSMSLDGFVEDGGGGVREVFAWTTSGDVEFTLPGGGQVFRTSQATADHLRREVPRTGALVCGRRLFDLTRGWGGRHPAGCPVFVVTHQAPRDWPHPEAPFTFVTDGVVSAIGQARAVAGAGTVAVATADITRQCLDLGLLDAISVDLVPVLLGAGTPFFANLQAAPIVLDTPTVVQGQGVTHL
jgi:dihydrofolate reductase